MIIRYIQHSGDDEGAGIYHSWVPLSEMSKYMPVAVIASEDQRFMTHHGFDYDAIEKGCNTQYEEEWQEVGSKYHISTNCKECISLAWSFVD